MNTIHVLLIRAWLLLLFCNDYCIKVHAKAVSGNVLLSGVNSEAVLTSFAISPYGRGWMGITLTTTEMYRQQGHLKIHLFQDTNWHKFEKATTCREKSRYSVQSSGLEFTYERQDQEWKSSFGMALNQEHDDRTHYWYVVIDDCSLEEYYQDGSIPTIHYELQLWNDVGGNVYKGGDDEEGIGDKNVSLTHLSADEVYSSNMHSVTLVLSLLIAALLLMYILKLRIQNGSIHVAFLLVMLAASMDALSSLCELIHLKKYKVDGIGYYAFDALASHFEAMTDSLVTILLLSVASGWTLPSDAVVESVGATRLQSLVGGMKNPAGALLSMSPAGWLTLGIFASHAFLAQWGRTFDDDFDAYHALEHLPGRILMLWRIVLGLLMVVAAVQTRNHSTSLQGFYSKLALVGTVWFQSLPFITWVATWMVPYHLRHVTVALWGAVAQSAALVLLTWLFTAHSSDSSYHKVSRLQNDETLTDQLASSTLPHSSKVATPKSWSFGKTKIRLD